MEPKGEVRFVSVVGDAATRTFRVEVEIDNSDGELPSGLSAEVTLPVETVTAHRVSPALGRLDEQGRLGVHVLDDEDRIAFLPVEVVRARGDGVWITGLPERVRIVTISQGSLAPGQQVDVTETPPEYLGAQPDNDAGVAAPPEGAAEANAPLEAGADNTTSAEDDG